MNSTGTEWGSCTASPFLLRLVLLAGCLSSYLKTFFSFPALSRGLHYQMCAFIHSSSCINGCVAVTSTGLQIKCSCQVVAGDREKGGRKNCSFALSWVHRVTWDKTILFMVILWNGWICFFYWPSNTMTGRDNHLQTVWFIQHFTGTSMLHCDMSSMVDKGNYYWSTW